MKIYCMVAPTRQHLDDLGPIPDDMITELRARGHDTVVGFAEDFLMPFSDIRSNYDLYLLKAHDELWLSIAAILHDQGARIINPYPACVASENKIVATQRLLARGIPVPQSWITASPNHLRSLVKKHPILIKPHIGGMGRSSLIQRINDENDLSRTLNLHGTTFIQAFIPGAAEDLKVYVIGDSVFALRKPFAPRNFVSPGRPCPVAENIARIAKATASAFGLELFGLDIIESDHGPFVVDVNYFPSFNGVDGAGRLLADYICNTAQPLAA